MSKVEEIKDLTIEELNTLYLELSKDLFNLYNELRTTKKLDKPHLLSKNRRDRARVLTQLNCRKEKMKQKG